jgi:hypothetical protein
VDTEAKKEESTESLGGVGGVGTSPLPDRSLSRTFSSTDTEHIAKKKRAMFQVKKNFLFSRFLDNNSSYIIKFPIFTQLNSSYIIVCN